MVSPPDPTTSDSPGMAPTSTQQPVDITPDAKCSEGNNSNGDLPVKQAWKKPPNSMVEPVVDMDILSWPLLSEINKAPAKVPASSSNVIADESLSISQGAVHYNSQSQKQGRSNGKFVSGTNHTVFNRQRVVKGGSGNRNLGADAPMHSNRPHPPMLPPPPIFPVPQLPPTNNGTVIPSGFRPAGDYAFQSQGSIDHQSSSRRGSFTPQTRGDPSNKDVGNYPNSKVGRVHQSRVSPRGLVRSPTPPAPPPMGSFLNSMGFPDYHYFPIIPLAPFRGMPFFTHGPPPAMFFPIPDSPLSSMLIKQIDYYFSDANLAGDEFLKSNMDEQGWISIYLIASFPRVKNLTSDVRLILNSLRSSVVVEVNDDRVRRRNDWMKWIPSPSSSSVCLEPDSIGISPPDDQDDLEASFENFTIDKRADSVVSDSRLEAPEGSGSTESQAELQLPNGQID